MSAIASISDLINRYTGGSSGTPEAIYQHKESRVAGAAAATPIIGQTISLLEYEGIPSHGAVPGTSWANPNNTTAGGLLQTDPGGSRQKWLTSLLGNASQAGTLVLYDRLGHISGLSGTSASVQNLNAGAEVAPTRYTNGLGNQIMLENYTQIGATPTTLTCAYDNQSNVLKTTPSIVWGGTNRREAQRAVILPLAAGDNGVQSITSVTAAGTTGTAGNFGVVLIHVLATLPLGSAGAAVLQTYLDSPIPEILTDACLAWLFIPTATTALTMDAFFSSVEA